MVERMRGRGRRICGRSGTRGRATVFGFRAVVTVVDVVEIVVVSVVVVIVVFVVSVVVVVERQFSSQFGGDGL